MVHREMIRSVKRFFGILIKKCWVDFPLWIAPTQLRYILSSIASMNTAVKLLPKLVSASTWIAEITSREADPSRRTNFASSMISEQART